MNNKPNPSYSQLEQQIMDECSAMAQYALSQGLGLPIYILEILRNPYAEQLIKPADDTAADAKLTPDTLSETAEVLQSGCMQAISGRNIIHLHASLTQIIKPVKPHVACMITAHTHSRKLFKFMGSVPLIRQMMFISLLSLIGLFAVSLSPSVNSNPDNFSLLQNSGYSLWINEMFLLFGASIGASFNALFIADKYAREGIWNPSFESSYWIRYILGLLSGSMLATLIPIEDIHSNIGRGSMNGFGSPVLALAGGFSSKMVYHVLIRLTETLESLVNGGTREKITVQDNSADNRLNAAAANEKMMLSARLTKIQSQLSTEPDSNALRQELESLQSELQANRPQEEPNSNLQPPSSPVRIH